mmetsp:Transcript_25433/g.61513  ORF Transcript_25433/g.61513 Transcript_25433/m.61513 type:complete len:83 (+) Transcript_25433:1047-1295(+)
MGQLPMPCCKVRFCSVRRRTCGRDEIWLVSLHGIALRSLSLPMLFGVSRGTVRDGFNERGCPVVFLISCGEAVTGSFAVQHC